MATLIQRFARSTGGGGSVATADATGLVYTVTGLKSGTTAILYGNGSQIGTTTVDGSGKAKWTLTTAPLDAIITYDGTITGTGGRSAAAPPAPVGSILNLSGAAPRVGITEASYWVRTGDTLARPDTGYEAKLLSSKADRSIPFASTAVPAGSVGYVSIKHEAVNAETSPPLYINWDGNPSQPSATTPRLPTVWVSNNSVTGSPDDGTWTQDTTFAAYRPTGNIGYVAIGQRYFWPTTGARWVQVRFDAVGLTQQYIPHIACSSGQWRWDIGMSIVRNMSANIASVNANRTAFMNSVPGSDPFFFTTARSGANQQAILDEQITPVLASPTLTRFIRGIYVNAHVNDVAYAGVRPYASQAATTIKAIRDRSELIYTKLKTLGVVVVSPTCGFGNFQSGDTNSAATPYVETDASGVPNFQSANGFFPYNRNVFGPVVQTFVPACWDDAYGIPFCSDYAGMAEKYDVDMNPGDSVHPGGTAGIGYVNMRTRRAPLDRLSYGLAAGQNTLQARIAALGTTPTAAAKARLLLVLDAEFAMHPAISQAQNDNRATLRSQLVALGAA